MTNMKAAVFNGKDVELKEVPVPTLTKNIYAPKKYDTNDTVLLENDKLVLLEVQGASICGTDLHILTGEHGSRPPVILGHEYVGKVLEVGRAVKNVRQGDLVAVDPNIKCGHCRFCVSGLPNMCENLTTLGIFIDGGFAEFNVAPSGQLYLLPSGLEIERAIFFEPLTCVVHGLKKVEPISGDKVLIFGAGPIGCYFAMLCRMHKALDILVVEPNAFRRNFLRDLGYRVAMPDEVVEKDYFDLVIDACGVPLVVPPAIEHVRRGGRVLLFGQQNIHARVEINPTIINQKELKVLGSYAAASSFEKTTQILADPQVPLPELITHRIALGDIYSAFDAMKSGKAMEILITPNKRRQ